MGTSLKVGAVAANSKGQILVEDLPDRGRLPVLDLLDDNKLRTIGLTGRLYVQEFKKRFEILTGVTMTSLRHLTPLVARCTWLDYAPDCDDPFVSFEFEYLLKARSSVNPIGRKFVWMDGEDAVRRVSTVAESHFADNESRLEQENFLMGQELLVRRGLAAISPGISTGAEPTPQTA